MKRNQKIEATFFHSTRSRAANSALLGVHHIFRDVDNLSTVTVIIEWENGEKAKEFLNSPILKEAAQKGGMIGVPMVRVVATQV